MLTDKPTVQRPLGRPRRRWEDLKAQEEGYRSRKKITVKCLIWKFYHYHLY